MRWFYIILLLAIVAVIVVFVFENREDQSVMFFNQRITAPLSAFFVATYLLGMWSGGTVVGFIKRAYRHATEHEEQRRASQGS
jgi:uncharacterized integral membrane protein